MKSVKYVLGLAILVVLIGAQMASACELNLQVTDGQKEIYEKEDVIIVLASVTLIHRNCSVGIEATKFECTGAEIVGATKWKNVGTNAYERKLKIQVAADDSDKIELTGTRTCRRGGAAEKLTLPKKPHTPK